MLAVYTLFLNSDMKNITLENEYMDIVYTNIINGNMIIQDCCDQFKIVEKEEEPPLIQKQLSLTSLLQK